MTELLGGEPVLDDELLYRRIPASTKWYDPDRTPLLEPEAFRPNRNDPIAMTTQVFQCRARSTRRSTRQPWGEQERSTTLPLCGHATFVLLEWKWRRDLFQTTRVMPKSQV